MKITKESVLNGYQRNLSHTAVGLVFSSPLVRFLALNSRQPCLSPMPSHRHPLSHYAFPSAHSQPLCLPIGTLSATMSSYRRPFIQCSPTFVLLLSHRRTRSAVTLLQRPDSIGLILHISQSEFPCSRVNTFVLLLSHRLPDSVAAEMHCNN